MNTDAIVSLGSVFEMYFLNPLLLPRKLVQRSDLSLTFPSRFQLSPAQKPPQSASTVSGPLSIFEHLLRAFQSQFLPETVASAFTSAESF